METSGRIRFGSRFGSFRGFSFGPSFGCFFFAASRSGDSCDPTASGPTRARRGSGKGSRAGPVVEVGAVTSGGFESLTPAPNQGTKRWYQRAVGTCGDVAV